MAPATHLQICELTGIVDRIITTEVGEDSGRAMAGGAQLQSQKACVVRS